MGNRGPDMVAEQPADAVRSAVQHAVHHTAGGGPDDLMAADGFRRLIRFHAEEPTPDFLEALRRNPLRGSPLALDRDDAIQAAALIDEVVSDLPLPITGASLVALSADFDAIYRSQDHMACPAEGPWTEDGQREDRALSLRRWRSGLDGALQRPPAGSVPWEGTSGEPVGEVPGDLPDDHLAHQLALLAALLDRGRHGDAVRFLDQHPLRWVPAFCSRVATRCREPFYAGVAILTNAHLDHLRDRLGAACGVPRPAADDDGATRRRRWTEGRFPRACVCD